jgi:hypothetical protein
MKAYPGIPISHAHCVCHWCVAAFEILRSDLEGNRGGRMLFRDSAKSPFSSTTSVAPIMGGKRHVCPDKGLAAEPLSTITICSEWTRK